MAQQLIQKQTRKSNKEKYLFPYLNRPIAELAGTPEFKRAIQALLPNQTFITASAALDFPSTNAQLSADLTISLPGAALGDPVILGVPHAAVVANTSYTAWVSATDVVTVRLNNYSSGAANPTSGTFKVTIVK